VARLVNRPLIYSVTTDWLDTVARGGSLFLPEAPVWIPETIDASARAPDHCSLTLVSEQGFQESHANVVLQDTAATAS
jgi:hypothetical protein